MDTVRRPVLQQRQQGAEAVAAPRRSGSDSRPGSTTTTTMLRPIPASKLSSGPGRAAKAAFQASALQHAGQSVRRPFLPTFIEHVVPAIHR